MALIRTPFLLYLTLSRKYISQNILIFVFVTNYKQYASKQKRHRKIQDSGQETV